MDAMILSAGAGVRMRPLTLDTPKPLLKAGGRCLIEHHLGRLSAAGTGNVVINTSYLAEKFTQTLGDGSSYGLRIRYSNEGDTPLETGGGILKALPLIETDPFLVMSADVWTDFPFGRLSLSDQFDGILLLVDNPDHHKKGDFSLLNGKVHRIKPSRPMPSYTYSGISILRKSMFASDRGKVFPLLEVFLDAVECGKLAGLHYQGAWIDVGTPERLDELNSMIGRQLPLRGKVEISQR